jgi:uncharacterized protein YkwD
MKKFLIQLLPAIVLLSFHSVAQTKIKFVNNTNLLVSAAYAKYSDNGEGWISKGWYNVKPGESRDINLGDYNFTTVYIYGYNKTSYWGKGQFQFCVNPREAFSISNADESCDYTTKTFSEFKITVGQVNVWNFGVPAKINDVENNENSTVTSANLSQQQKNEFVARHNYWRNQVGSPAVVWSEQLATYAYEWAKHLADNDLFEHRQNDKYGENIFMCYSCSAQTFTPSKVVDDWASEKKYYHGENITGSNFSKFGHYTQVIWCQTTQLGCAMVPTTNGNMIVVCNYSPAGNMLGEMPTCN